ncbi:PAQR family membrane homeostasis protein TrhA [Quadrisphaera setariae]|uniref:PAQR family membrane homeostasis protein TrhA n=1 Tax=Quadrisphaera setariae TaxID=2593304 RepID=UPI00165052B7|nr:hemolysin III family protein [Quadrisphaera setariae]
MSATTPALPAPTVSADALAELPHQRPRRAPASTADVAVESRPEKPLLRGWLHAGLVPVVLASGAVLLPRAGTPAQTGAVAVYLTVSAVLFATSALYHRLSWSPEALLRVQRLDHGNIPLAVAACATPLLVVGLPGRDGSLLLVAVWAAALLAAAARWLWPSCPRPLHTAGTVALGWAVVPSLPAVAAHGQPVVAVLVVVGGVLFTAGGAVYATRWPEPSPRWFGHHEVFHALTVVAWPVHAAAVWLLCA